MNNLLTRFVRDLFYLFYPKYCIACDDYAPVEGQIFCTHCLIELPFTNHLDNPDNLLALRYKGRQDLIFASAIFEMYQEGIIAKMVHAIKYQGRKDIAFELGKYYGLRLVDKQKELLWDCIIPVPLHKKKLRKRGYNQSLEFAKGLSEVLDIPIYDQVLIKYSDLGSQTKQGRKNRIKNVFDSFAISGNESLANKHILMVDDVVTTGATLDACMINLSTQSNLRFSIAIIALAKH